MNKYKEILRLKSMLEKAKIPFSFYKRELSHGYLLRYPTAGVEKRVCSVIEHDYSYGHEKDLLEIMGLMTKEELKKEHDDVLGYLTAENVFQRIEKHWKSIKG